MSDLSPWLQPACDALAEAASRGTLVLSTGPISDADAQAVAQSQNLQLVVVDARIFGLLPDGVIRAALRDELGGTRGAPDEDFCVDALGDGEAAQNTWDALCSRWEPAQQELDVDFGSPFDDFEDDEGEDEAAAASPADLPGDDSDRRVEALVRILVAASDVQPRLVLLRSPDLADSLSLAALRGALAGGRGAGTAWIIEGPLQEGGAVQRLLAPIARAADDHRFDGPMHATIAPPESPDEGPSPPGRGTAAELLAMLQAGGVAYPEEALGSAPIAAYRGQSPRTTYQDLEGLLHTKRVAVVDGWVSADGHGAGAQGPLARADARALFAGVDDAPPAILAGLALAAEQPHSADIATSAGRDLLDHGDALGAQRWLDRTAAWLGGSTSPEVSLLRGQAARRLGDTRTASRLVREALLSGTEGDLTEARLHLEAGRLAALEGDDKTAQKHLEIAATLATELDERLDAGEANLCLAELHEAAGRYHPGAAAAAAAAKAFEHGKDTISAARAFAMRAICIAGAGLAPRALQELKHAMKRTPDPDDPRPGALDVRIAMGLIFRESGDREKARQALALAAKRAHTHALADREALARLNLARFHLEAIPVRGAERGEALSAGREAAEAAIHLSRGLGRADLEAEAEALLGELAWRSEDWESARDALGREQDLWEQAGNVVRVVDVALRRGQLASRQEDWPGAFKAANAALNQAQRKRLTGKLAQAQMLRGEALQHLDRKDEALQSLQEAHRIFISMGAEFTAQAGAAERRAQQLVAGGA